MPKTKNNTGFTMVEIMIVVLIIGILLTIALPSFIKARETANAKSCSENLSKIRWAKDQWAMENNKNGTDTPTQSDLAGSFASISGLPTCPSSGVYTINNVNTDPTCSIGGAHNIYAH